MNACYCCLSTEKHRNLGDIMENTTSLASYGKFTVGETVNAPGSFHYGRLITAIEKTESYMNPIVVSWSMGDESGEFYTA